MLVTRLPILIFMFCLPFIVAAQKPVAADTLSGLISAATSNTEKAKLLFERGDQLSLSDTINSVRYIQEGIQYVPGDDLYLGIGYFYLGRVYMDFSQSKAAAAFDTALVYFQLINTQESYIYQSRIWANKAVMAQMNDDNRKYIDLFLNKAIPLAAKGGDSLRMAEGFANVALPFMNYGEYGKALLYLDKSAALFKRLAPRDLRQVDIYSHFAKIHILKGGLNEAENSLERAATVLKQEPESVYAPNFHTVESMYLIKRGRWKPAAQSIEKGLAIAQKLKNRIEIRQLLYQKSALFQAQGNWRQSIDVLLKMYNEGYVHLLSDKKQLFSDLAILEQRSGNYRQAYDWMLQHEEVSEQIYNQETKTKITDLEARYSYVQKEKELLIAREKTKKQQSIFWITSVVFLLTLVVIYFWLQSRKLRTARQIDKLKQQQRIELGKALLEGEEKERSRLARDLHDGLGGMLAGIKLNLSQMVDTNEQLGRRELRQTIERLGQSVNELRRISRNMMPESLLHSGLETALKDLCDEAALPELNITFRAFAIQEHFSPQIQVMIYRIVQELVYNALKHADATKIIVQCSQAEDVFFITVEDNGKGFSHKAIPANSRGLKNIRNRVDLLRGKMEIESSGEGTNINIELYVA